MAADAHRATEERAEAIARRFAKELEAISNDGPYGASLAMAILVQTLRIVITQTNQPAACVERIVQMIATPGTSTDWLTQRPS